jgi:hypothetical protein
MRANVFSSGIGGAEVATGAIPREKYRYTTTGSNTNPRINPKRNFPIDYLR